MGSFSGSNYIFLELKPYKYLLQELSVCRKGIAKSRYNMLLPPNICMILFSKLLASSERQLFFLIEKNILIAVFVQLKQILMLLFQSNSLLMSFKGFKDCTGFKESYTCQICSHMLMGERC